MKYRNEEKILQRLDWTVIRRLDGFLQGDYRTLFHGFGLDLAELREYQLTDDVRYIDWNVTARLQTPYVRQYTEDREVAGWFLLDLSPSVNFGTAETVKRDLLVDFVTVIARLLTRHGNKVGAILYNGEGVGVISPGGGKLQVMRLIKDLETQPEITTTGQTDLSVLLNTALNVIKRRSLVFIVSDFMSVPGWEKPLHLLAQRNEIMAVRLYDPREVELPDIGPVVMEDAETHEQLFVDTNDRGFRARFTELARRRENELVGIFGHAGASVLSLSTEGDLLGEIIRFAMRRKELKRRPIAGIKANKMAVSRQTGLKV
jgi:uncharacterized protein (DUF58 family)